LTFQQFFSTPRVSISLLLIRMRFSCVRWPVDTYA